MGVKSKEKMIENNNTEITVGDKSWSNVSSIVWKE